MKKPNCCPSVFWSTSYWSYWFEWNP